MTIRKAVFPMGGMGTRFLPATKAVPKELFPVVERPLLQYAVEDALRAGARELVFVTARHKRMAEEYLDTNPELERELEVAGKRAMLDAVRGLLPKDASVTIVRQQAPLGVANALWCARHLLREPFFMLYPDELLLGTPSSCQELLMAWQKTQGHVLVGTCEVPEADQHRYGMVLPDKCFDDGLQTVRCIAEKPDVPVQGARAAVGRYVMGPALIRALEPLPQGVPGEWPLYDAVHALCAGHQVWSVPLSGTRFDCGSHEGYVKATLHVALSRPDLAESLVPWLMAHPAVNSCSNF